MENIVASAAVRGAPFASRRLNTYSPSSTSAAVVAKPRLAAGVRISAPAPMLNSSSRNTPLSSPSCTHSATAAAARSTHMPIAAWRRRRMPVRRLTSTSHADATR